AVLCRVGPAHPRNLAAASALAKSPREHGPAGRLGSVAGTLRVPSADAEKPVQSKSIAVRSNACDPAATRPATRLSHRGRASKAVRSQAEPGNETPQVHHAECDDKLQPRIDRLAFERQDAEDAFVDAPQRLAADEPLERLDPQGEFAERERSLLGQSAIAEPREVLFGRVIGSVNDAELLAAAALDRRLHQTAAAAGDEFQRLDDHSLAAARGKLVPPADPRLLAGCIGKVDDEKGRGDEEPRIVPA